MDWDTNYGLHPGQIIELLIEDDPKTILEIGSSNGEDSNRILKHLGELDRLFCVEADPRALDKHKKNVCDSRCSLTHAAITNIDSEGIFHLCTASYGNYGEWDLASSLKKIKHGLVVNPWLKYEKDIVVRYVKLDTFCGEKDIIADFIWCDVEGAYSEVVDGGIKSLENAKYFYVECEDVETYEGEIMYPALREKMESLGYSLLHRFKYDALFKNERLK